MRLPRRLLVLSLLLLLPPPASPQEASIQGISREADAADPSAIAAIRAQSAGPNLDVRQPLYWSIVGAHAAALLGIVLSLCTCAHGKSYTAPLALVGAACFTALDWLAPLATHSAIGGGWLYSVVPPPAPLGECNVFSQCIGADAGRAAGADVLVCAVAMCMPPAEYLAALKQCRLPYGERPAGTELSQEVYVRLSGGAETVKTRVIRSSTGHYDWDLPAAKIDTLLTTKDGLKRAYMLDTEASAWQQGRLDSHRAAVGEIDEELEAFRWQRLADAPSHCVVLPERPMDVQLEGMRLQRWGSDESLGQAALPALQLSSLPKNCLNFPSCRNESPYNCPGPESAVSIVRSQGSTRVPGAHTVAACEATCRARVGCHTFFHGVETGVEPGSCILVLAQPPGNAGGAITPWRCQPALSTEEDFLEYSMAVVGAGELVDEWLSLAPAGGDGNVSRRCTTPPCVRVSVYDGQWAQFTSSDADDSGGLNATELGDLLASVPALNFFANEDGVETVGPTSAAEDAALASTAEALMEAHDADGDGTIDTRELQGLWRERLAVTTPAYLGKHPLRLDDGWLSFCAAFAALVVGLLLGGWGNHEE